MLGECFGTIDVDPTSGTVEFFTGSEIKKIETNAVILCFYILA